jgi:hypothetical protein
MMNPFKAYTLAHYLAVESARRYRNEANAFTVEAEYHENMTRYVKAFRCREAAAVRLQMAKEALSFLNIMFDTIELTINGSK